MKILILLSAIFLFSLTAYADSTSKTFKVKVGNCNDCSFTSIQQAIEYAVKSQDSFHWTSQIVLEPGIYKENINLNDIYIGILSIVGSVDDQGKPNSFVIGSISDVPTNTTSSDRKLLLLKNLDISTEKAVVTPAITANTLLLSNVRVHDSIVGLALNGKNGRFFLTGQIAESENQTFSSCSDSFSFNSQDCIDYLQYPSSALFENNDIAIDEDLNYKMASSARIKYEIDNFSFSKNKIGLRINKWPGSSSSTYFNRYIKNCAFSDNKTAILYKVSSNFSMGVNVLKSIFTKNAIALNIPNLTYANPGMKNEFKSNKVAISVREKIKSYANKKKYFGKFISNKIDLKYPN